MIKNIDISEFDFKHNVNDIICEFVKTINDGFKNDVLLIYGKNFECVELEIENIIELTIKKNIIKIVFKDNNNCDEFAIINNNSIDCFQLRNY